MEGERENIPESEREERIRHHAHSLWEQDGRPEGKDKEHWQRAVSELEGEASSTTSDTSREAYKSTGSLP